jgi:geranylgeranyl diphosphate synthase type I
VGVHSPKTVDLATLYGYLPRLERAIADSYRRERPGVPRPVVPYVDLVRGFTLRGGKRFRALLVLAGYQIASGRPPDVAMPAAVALEHFQSWMLVHDDIIDHATERRGGPSLHREVADVHRRARGAGPSDDYGAGVALTLGDLEEPYAVGGIASVPVDGARRLAAIDEYVRMTRLTAYGQLLDLRNGTVGPESVRESDVLTVHRLKSAFYTVASPLAIGAHLAGAAQETVRDLERFALDAGVAFQLRDDVLGAGFGDEGIGKSANDLVEGKRTLLVVRLWQVGSAAEKAAVRKVLGRPDATAQEIGRARESIRSSGSLAYSERRIAALRRRALRRVEASRAIRPSAKALLGEVAAKLVDRTN